MKSVGTELLFCLLLPSFPSFLFFVCLFVTLPCDVSGFQGSIYKKIHHERYDAIYIGTSVSRYKASYP